MSAQPESVVVPEERRAELRRRLQRFLEAFLDTRVVDANDGALRMLLLHARNRNTKIKEKFIRYKLGELDQRLLGDDPLTLREAIVCEFLLDELDKYVSSKLK